MKSTLSLGMTRNGETHSGGVYSFRKALSAEAPPAGPGSSFSKSVCKRSGPVWRQLLWLRKGDLGFGHEEEEALAQKLFVRGGAAAATSSLATIRHWLPAPRPHRLASVGIKSTQKMTRGCNWMRCD